MCITTIQQLKLHFNQPCLTRFEPPGPTSETTLDGSKHTDFFFDRGHPIVLIIELNYYVYIIFSQSTTILLVYIIFIY